MALTSDLMGLGTPAAVAAKLGNVITTLTGNGTTQTGATLINGSVAQLTTSGGNTAFILPSAPALSRLFFIWNITSTTALIYPPVGGNINNAGANTAISIPQNTGGIFTCLEFPTSSTSTWQFLSGAGDGGTGTFGSLTVTGTSALQGGSTLTAPVVVGAGSATVTPLKLTSGTVNTTAVAGAIEYDGNDLYFSNAASSRGVVEVDQFIYVQAAITLVSQTGAQPIFVGTSGGTLTNGEIILPIGTFEFDSAFNISAMSSTSGGFGFSITAGGSAVIGQQSWEAYANKATLATPAAWQSSWNTGASTELATATTTTVGFARIRGSFTLTTAGPIIPNLSFTTVAGAATPIVGVGSYFRVRQLGNATVNFVGDWS